MCPGDKKREIFALSNLNSDDGTYLSSLNASTSVQLCSVLNKVVE